ncbi:unnamed protein product [Thlaspi arvense]|uniref:Zinc finger A20 and AN1 domain-containing stress-associated protein 1 n=1 Tax=Thlaspi arvense TaxID=13288 RepID=A0AAU9RUS4_THLAR|nr:unnamed protein product [Thlaspi arvense]
MGSEQNDSTSFSPSEPKLCVNGCGFFGTAANMNFCSKCYHDLRVTEEQASSAKAAFQKSLNPKPKISLEPAVGSSSTSSETAAFSEPPPPQTTAKNRCLSCKKKVGLMGFKCRCGSTFCGDHRYPENHECEFDFKGEGRDAIGKANPLMKAKKMERI